MKGKQHSDEKAELKQHRNEEPEENLYQEEEPQAEAKSHQDQEEESQAEAKSHQDQEPETEENLRMEDVLAQVERCIAQLEDPQISLEDAFRYYEEGVRKLKICNQKADQIEKNMLVLSERGELEEF